MRRHYPRRACEIPASRCAGVVAGDDYACVPAAVEGLRGAGATKDDERLLAAISRMRTLCPDFRNFHFRTLFTSLASPSLQEGEDVAVLMSAIRVAPPLRFKHVVRPGGDIYHGDSALNATLALSGGERQLCTKPGLIFAAHPSTKADVVCLEEEELLLRTNWCTGFLDSDTSAALRLEALSGAADRASAKAMPPPQLAPGQPECMLAQEVSVLRSGARERPTSGAAQQAGPSEERLELEAAVCFLPQSNPALDASGSKYARREDRLAYHRQVEAVLRACCLLDLDGLCIGCLQGFAGSALYGHPLREAAEVWKEALLDPGVSPSRTPMAAQFKRIVIAVPPEAPSHLRNPAETAHIVREVFADMMGA
eukprot:TRINITY_DN11960_c0_g1_i2.p1 TRINITY_DN11960_c0_g1~~TRINITY_DN11960_c0_g1_i2.p1  ORF type:complete len:368 (-),score=66.01 TRINITY_DN11960_c0_g1_i2:148-1251(-)